MPSIHDLPPPDPKTRDGSIPPPYEYEPPISDYTQRVDDLGIARRRQMREYLTNGLVRPTIGSNRRIGAEYAADGTMIKPGGVYEGDYGGEAISIDTERPDSLINAAYDEILQRISPDGMPNKQLALETVFHYVREKMPYDAQTVDWIFQKKLEGQDGQEVSLDMYIAYGAGVCRHQALFAGVLLEKLVDAGILTGKVSVDRNQSRMAQDDEYSGHAWVRYTNSRGDVIILDPAHGVIDMLPNLQAARRRGETVWDYTPRDDGESEAIADTLPRPVRRRDMGRVAMQEEAPEEPVSERDRLRRYYQGALAEKRRAQLAGDGDGSSYWGQQAGQYYKELLRLDGYIKN